MRTCLFCVALMSVGLASCAESVHQRERMGLGSGAYQAPPVARESPPVAEPEHPPRAVATPSANLQVQQGQYVTLSGTVLKAKRLDGMTEIEILHLPAGAGGRPTEDRRQSQGRFIARQTTFLDPAILTTRPMVTVHGVVEGEVERPLEPGSDNYAYPIVAIQELTLWPPDLAESQAGSYAAPASSAGLSRADSTGDFMLNILGSMVTGLVEAIFSPNRTDYGSSSYSTSSPSSSKPSPPPQKDIPPQFQKNQR